MEWNGQHHAFVTETYFLKIVSLSLKYSSYFVNSSELVDTDEFLRGTTYVWGFKKIWLVKKIFWKIKYLKQSDDNKKPK